VRGIKDACRFFLYESSFALLVALLINIAVISVSGTVCFSGNLSAEDAVKCSDLSLDSSSFLLKAGSCHFITHHNQIGVVYMLRSSVGINNAFIDFVSFLFVLYFCVHQNVLGRSSAIVYGVALLASGQSSTITGTYSGQYIMQVSTRIY